jgi:hypothetical protein
MAMPAAMNSGWSDFGLRLQRKFWKPLRSTMDIFHVLPLGAAAVLFILLGTDGQFRELYISYLEGPRDPSRIMSWLAWVASMAAGLLAIGLISAVLYEAHYALSTMRLNIIYSSYSNPDANSRLRNLQKAAAFCLAFVPWFGLTVGLLNARNFVADRYCKLLTDGVIAPTDLYEMQHLWLPAGRTIAEALIFLGVATAFFSSTNLQNRIAPRTVALCSPLAAAFLFLLFTDTYDFRLDYSWLTLPVALLLAVATLVNFFIYRWLFRKRGGFFSSDNNKGTGIPLHRRRQRWLAVWAFVPWLLMAAYFVCAQFFASPPHAIEDWSGRCPFSNIFPPMPGQWTAFPVAMCYSIGIGLLVGHVLARFADHEGRRRTIMTIVLILAFICAVVSFCGPNAAVWLYRSIGPLGTVALQLLFLISTFAFLAALSQRSGFPVLTLVILALVVALMFPSHIEATAWVLGFICTVVAVMALMVRRVGIAVLLLLLPVLLGISAHQYYNATIVGQNPSTPVPDSLKVKYEFSCWLRQRGIPVANAAVEHDAGCEAVVPSPESQRKHWPSGNKYPVFIVAAEGGGIYAASAVSTFLARLQDAVPQFDDHVFAVSGVSGGSIGSAIFQALDRAWHTTASADPGSAVPTPSCPKRPHTAATHNMESKVQNIIQDDHFSPVIGAVFPEMFGAPLSRSDALVASFEDSTATQDVTAGKDLGLPFAAHWSAAGFAPALILNSTWVEMGYRVAFAPFSLNDLDESLYSFSDPSMPTETDLSLMQAAGVSARFPFIMPPLSAVMESKVTDAKTGEIKTVEKRWNFVDGAYSDNSGATSALDIYKAIESVAEPYVDLRLILISSSVTQPDLTSSDINGTVFRDTVAPIDALMKVREDLGNDAVARACTYVYHDDLIRRPVIRSSTNASAAKSKSETNEDCVEYAGDPQAPLHIVEIQDQTYGLSLGWKISKTSFDVVSWMLGSPDICPAQKIQSTAVPDSNRKDEAATEENVNAQLSKNILDRNSRVLSMIERLVDRSSATPVTAKSGDTAP